MKTTLTTILIFFILIGCSTVNVSAQSRPENTSSAQAAYGVFNAPVKHKTKKKQKTRKIQKQKQAKISREKSPVYRRRSNWAG